MHCTGTVGGALIETVVGVLRTVRNSHFAYGGGTVDYGYREHILTEKNTENALDYR